MEDLSDPMDFILSSFFFVLCLFLFSGFSARAKYQIEGVETEVLSLSTEQVRHRQWPCSLPLSHQCASVLAEGLHVQGKRALQSPCPSILGSCAKIAKKGAQSAVTPHLPTGPSQALTFFFKLVSITIKTQ